MAKHESDLLKVLTDELHFTERGGYRYTARVPWRPQFIFQDSPTCLNFDGTAPRQPCADCILMQFVPADLRKQKIPCRHIILNDKGQTIDYFYRYGTEEELEQALVGWLKAAIRSIESERAEKRTAAVA